MFNRLPRVVSLYGEWYPVRIFCAFIRPSPDDHDIATTPLR